jgi:glycosyltransferase involved in cell wall biosynthesis
MTILIFTQYYPPEVGATQNRLHLFASRLARRGHDVTVVTEVPNHPAGIIAEGYRGVLCRRSLEDGVKVIRVWVATSPRKSFLVRIAFYLTYALNAAIAALLFVKRPDVIFTSSPPLTVGLPALACARLFRKPLVLDVRDLWPVLAVELGEMRNRTALKLSRALERTLYRDAAAITVVTEGFRTYVERAGVPRGRIALVPNGTLTDLFRPVPPDAVERDRLGLAGHFVVGFFGNHGIAQDLDRVVDAARLLQDDDRFRFLFVGEGPVKAALQERAAHLRNVVFRDQVPQAQVIPLIALADVVLVPLKRLELFKTFVPSKLFDFMACERPIVLQVDGEAREILERAGAGVFVEPGDVDALAGALRRLISLAPAERRAMGERGRAFVARYYRRDAQVDVLEELLARAAGVPVASRSAAAV